MKRKEFIEEIKDVNEKERSIIHMISTESVDRMGDIVRSTGMDDSLFSKNPVVLYGHDYRSFPVGKSLWRKVAERDGVKGVLAKTQFADTEDGHQVFKLWEGGYLNAASIGFKPLEFKAIDEDDKSWGAPMDFLKWELMEYSIVPVPANGEALRLAVEKGLASEKVLFPIQEALIEKRICELEECKGGFQEMKDKLDFFMEIGQELDIARIAHEKMLEEFRQTVELLTEEIKQLKQPKAEIAAMDGEAFQKLNESIARSVRGVISQARGRVE